MSDIEKYKTSVDFYRQSSLSENTKRAYTSDWRAVEKFMTDNEFSKNLPISSEHLAFYISHMADSGKSISAIVRRLTAISTCHQIAGFPSPTKSIDVTSTMKGIRKTRGKAAKSAASITWIEIQRMAEKCEPNVMGIRDRAILLIGWAGALRRSEIVALNLSDLYFSENGLIVTITKSKTDQEYEGRKIAIPSCSGAKNCPVHSVSEWIARRSSSTLPGDEPLFCRIGANGARKWFVDETRCGSKRLGDRMISIIVHRYAEICGLKNDRYSAHSLRRGLATEAGARGIPERIIARHTRHVSITQLRKYIDDGNIWTENPLSTIFSSGTVSRVP